MTLRYLSLFSGIGALDYGLCQAGLSPVGQVEVDPFCRAVLAKHWPDVARHDDVRTFTGSQLATQPRLVAGGFPCQDISAAGKGAGLAGARSGLWSEFRRIIGECRPDWVVVENVPVLRSRGADTVLGDLEALGYAWGQAVVGAEHVGAPHKRHRCWIVATNLAHAQGDRRTPDLGDLRPGRPGEPAADKLGDGAVGRDQLAHAPHDGPTGGPGRGADRDGAVPTQPTLGRGAVGGAGEPVGRGGDELADADAAGRRRQRAGANAAGVAGLETEDGSGVGERGGSAVGRSAFGSGVRGLADADCHERRASGHRDDQAGPVGAALGGRLAWPARPGQPQHGWEAPRLTQRGVGGTVDGAPARLLRPTAGHARAVVAGQSVDVEAFATWANRHALKGYGNAVVWLIPYLLGCYILDQEQIAAAGSEVSS